MSDFTYELPNNESFMKALFVKLKTEGSEDIAEILRRCKCEIVKTGAFAYPRGRWNAFVAIFTVLVPVDNYESVYGKITEEIKDKILTAANSLMPKIAGLDILSVNLSPLIEDIFSEESLISESSEV